MCTVGRGRWPFEITKNLGRNRKGFIATKRLLTKVGEGCNYFKMLRKYVEVTGGKIEIYCKAGEEGGRLKVLKKIKM